MADKPTLPQWFLDHNVILKEALNDLPSNIEVVDRARAKEVEPVKKPSDQATDTPKPGTAKYQVSSDEFAPIRDSFASAFVPNSEGQLDQTQSFVALRTTNASPLDFLDRVLKYLAKDVGASIISLGVDDLLDLSLEFSMQTPDEKTSERPGKDKSKSWVRKHIDHWLLVSSNTDKGSEAWERSQQSFSTILDAIQGDQPAGKLERDGGATDTIPAEQPAENSDGDGDSTDAVLVDQLVGNLDGEGDATDAIPPDQPATKKDSTGLVIVHVHEIGRIMAMDKGHRVFGRLCDCVQKRRQNGQKIAVVMTFRDLNKEECKCYECEPGSDPDWDDIYRYTCATKSSSQYINPIDPVDDPVSHVNNKSAVNTRFLQRILRERLRHLLDPEILRPHSNWGQLLCTGTECFGQDWWSWDEGRRAFLQISGRSLGKEKLEAWDVLDVLTRLGLHKHPEPVKEDEQKPAEEAAEKDDDKESTEEEKDEEEKKEEEKDEEEEEEEKKETWEEKINKIREKCNQEEESLLDCVINPDKIQSGYSQVIIDKDLKDTVLHLVSSAYLKPSSTSSSLLSQVRIKGILLYGPPGTGKTHLTRSIARESGASMLCVDGATLLGKYVGETEKHIKAAFTLAAKLYPCVLFIDEVDSLFCDRRTTCRSWERRSVTQFLMEMDGLAQSDNAPCVIVATNRPDSLDKAFLRRLPQKIPINLPDLESRTQILKLLLEGEALEPLVEIDSLARETDGYSGSDLRSLCADAALLWAIEESKKQRDSGDEPGNMRLGLAHFAKAFQRIRPSVSKKDLKDLEAFAKEFSPCSIKG